MKRRTLRGAAWALCCGLSFAVATLCGAADAQAEPFRLAIDLDHGGNLPRALAFDALLVPGVDVGRLRLAAVVGTAFENPDWALVLGVRPSVVLWAPVTPSTGLRLVTDASFVTPRAWRWSGGLALDFESVHVGFLAGYDSFHDSLLALTTVGFDIPTIVRFIGDGWLASSPTTCGP